jgi:transcription termination factor Rho
LREDSARSRRGSAASQERGERDREKGGERHGASNGGERRGGRDGRDRREGEQRHMDAREGGGGGGMERDYAERGYNGLSEREREREWARERERGKEGGGRERNGGRDGGKDREERRGGGGGGGGESNNERRGERNGGGGGTRMGERDREKEKGRDSRMSESMSPPRLSVSPPSRSSQKNLNSRYR